MSRQHDELEHLRRQLQAAEQRAGAAEQRAGAAEQRAGVAESLLGEVQQRLEEERGRSENTTFSTFLQSCHALLSDPLQVQTDRSLTTKGSITNPKGRKHPASLRLWHDFPELQQQCFDQAYSFLTPDNAEPPKLFSPLIALQDLGNTLCRRPLASEKDLEHYQRFSVEEKVKDVMEQLMKIPEANSLLNQCNGFEFENHLNSLSDNAEEVMQRQRQSKTDQACVFRDIQGHRSLLFVVEYKPAHKLSVEYLRGGLRPMQLREEVVLRETIPLDPGEKLNYNADRLVGAAVTQTFEYMIDNGLEYSYITTGQAFVFLRVLEDDPTTVYYYLAEPNMDVGKSDDLGFRYPFTAISRVLSFCLLALQSPVRNQAWRDGASRLLCRWNQSFDDIIYEIPADERLATPPASVYKPPAYPIHPRSPYLLRSRLPALSGDTVPTEPHFTDSSSSDGSFSQSHGRPSVFDTPSRPSGGMKRKRTSGHNWNSTYRSSARHQWPSYCTQKCLLGLKRKAALDPACPNYDRHRHHPRARFHQFSITSFHQQIRAQLTADMDHDCEPLGKQGARGALFAITLSSHGYTFVGKGTVEAFVPDLLHEGQVYEQLEEVQGSAVPVCLGNMDLDRTYYLDVGVRIVHMLYMAWGGNSLHDETPSISTSLLKHETRRSIDEVSRFYVFQMDSRLANMLWNIENQRVMLIDFERSTIQKGKRRLDSSHVLRELSPNKRRRRQENPTKVAEARI